MRNISMVITNPAENCHNSMNVSWHSNLDFIDNYIEYHKKYSNKWIKVYPESHKVEVFDNVYTISKKRKDFYQKVKFLHHEVTLTNLEEECIYYYRINGFKKIYSFKTSPKSNFSFLWFSDFHAYPPAPKRLENAQNILTNMAKKHSDYDFILCTGDTVAWGGSYKFWLDAYNIKEFKTKMLVNVLGNHDHMSRGYLKDTSDYFKEVNNFPKNSYPGEEGITYFFKYGDTLFIVFHNEHMGVGDGEKKEEIKKGYDFLEKTIKENPSKHIVLLQHYQWINGTNGRERTFGYLRWKDLCDKYHIDLALSANDHTYIRTYPMYHDEVNESGTVYMQCPSCDGERGVDLEEVSELNPKLAHRYATGRDTVAALYVSIQDDYIETILYDRDMNIVDQNKIIKKVE